MVCKKRAGGRYFNPLPPHGGRRGNTGRRTGIQYFNPLPPHGGRPAAEQTDICRQTISIHSLRMEGDGKSIPLIQVLYIFQSTPSAWRETMLFPVPIVSADISIHSLRMEGDNAKQFIYSTCIISIHSLRMEGDPVFHICLRNQCVFQSTPSAWRETFNRTAFWTFDGISIHSLRMEGDAGTAALLKEEIISIHSLRMEGDANHIPDNLYRGAFQSTPSAWRETCFLRWLPCASSFQSTPSAWRETFSAVSADCRCKHFNPLPPHGGRPAL